MAVTVSLYNHTSKLLLDPVTKIDSTNLRVKLLSASASFVASHAAIYTVDNGTTATVTMTSASPCVITWTAHGFSAGQAVRFTSTGALYTGLTAGVWYYVIATGLSTNTFQVSATVGGAAINTSGSQSGTHTGLSAGPYEVWGNAWPAGGVTLTTVAASTVTTNDATITADNVGITASGGGIGPSTAAIIYDATSLKPLAYYDFGQSKTADNGTPFNIVWPAGGIFPLTY